MQANKFTEFGMGDSATWPPFAGHPHDPRAPLDESNGDDEETKDVIGGAIQLLDMAIDYIDEGDIGKARHALIESQRSIADLLGPAQ